MASCAALVAQLLEGDSPGQLAEVCALLCQDGFADAADAVEPVVAALRRWPSHVVLQGNAIAALVQLCSSDAASVAKAGAAGAIEAIVAAMRAHAAHTDVQHRCCCALFPLVRRNAAHQAKACAAGAVEALLAALNAHMSAAAVANSGCAALNALLLCRDEDAAKAVALGAVATVVACMRAHPADACVQTPTCSLLGNLCMRPTEKASEAGAAGEILSALRTHASSSSVQYAGCFALGNILAYDLSASAQRKALAGGGIVAAVAALRTHPTAPHVQLEACYLLSALATGADERAIAGAAAVRAVMAALRTFPDDAGVQWRGSAAMRMLVCQQDLARVALDDGTWDVMSSSLRAHIGHVPAARMCVSVLCWLFERDEGVRTALGATRAVLDAVVAALLAHPTDVLLQVEGLNFLGHTGVHDGAHARASVAAGAADAVHAALGASMGSADAPVLLSACYHALRAVVLHEEPRVIRAGVLEAMLGADRRRCARVQYHC
jgi:hypothetical protein